MPILTTAPGKIILFGEHAVVHGAHAIAAPISLSSVCFLEEAKTPHLSLRFPDLNIEYQWGVEELPSYDSSKPIEEKLDIQLLEELNKKLIDLPEMAHAACLAVLYLYTILLPRKPITIALKSSIPLGAGLGSSASISVVLSSAMLYYLNRTDKEEINKYAFLSECCIHGTPSGLDNTISTFGKTMLFTRQGKRQVIPSQKLSLILTNTQQSRSTKILVASVSSQLKIYPTVVKGIIDTIDLLVQESVPLLASGNLLKLAELVDINQHLLAAIQVSHPKIEYIISLSKEVGIGSSKLTGAGGGGCVFTILKDETKITEFEKALEARGMKTFKVDVIDKGVGISRIDISIEDFLASPVNDLLSREKFEYL